MSTTHRGTHQVILTSLVILALCLPLSAQAQRIDGAPQDTFWQALKTHCGLAYGGEMAVYDEVADAAWVGQPMTIYFIHCAETQIHIGLNVGENRSRTWVIERHPEHLSLKHIHRHEDGVEDTVSWYGGMTQDPGRAHRQAFAVDAYSQALFYAQGLEPSVNNIWYMELVNGASLTYGLTRPNRHFQATFDLTQPIDTPPAPWGASYP